MALGNRLRAKLGEVAKASATSKELRTRVANFSKRRVAELIEAGRASHNFRRSVDGVADADDDTVKLNGGRIVYEFASLSAVARFALTYAKLNSRRLTGAYAEAWFLVVDGKPWTQSIDAIPADAREVLVTNFAPYAEALEERGRHGRSGRRSSYASFSRVVTERARQATASAFPNFEISRVYISLAGVGGIARGWRVPWIREGGFERGQAIVYPAVRITRSR